MALALYELYMALREAWRVADLRQRLVAWWYVVTHRDLLDSPKPVDD